jgi:DNA-binding LytR/AlgR family response regulator
MAGAEFGILHALCLKHFQKAFVKGIAVKPFAYPALPSKVRDGTARPFKSLCPPQPATTWQSVRLAIKVDRTILFINLGDVIIVRSEGNYVSLQGNLGCHLVRDSISALAEILEPFRFIRIHRSVLVNSAFVEDIKSDPTGEYRLHIRGGTEYLVTRTYRSNLKFLADYWLGTDISF